MLSVVTQALALIFIYLCAGEDLPPPFGDVDEGWHWDIHTDQGWVFYWDSQVYIIREGPLSSTVKSVCLS
jgi:hypothetical protein